MAKHDAEITAAVTLPGTVKLTAKACEYERESVLACEGDGAPVRNGGGGLGRGA